MPRFGLLNYSSGNYGSVRNALLHLGIEPLEITRPEQMREASHLVLPGVGAFPAAMDRLAQLDLIDELREQVVVQKKPFLGICIGMQILAEVGLEFGERQGLGFLRGRVERIDAESRGLRTPHMGWNQLVPRKDSPLLADLPTPSSFYFVHSFHLRLHDPADAAATCEYGGEITACVQRDNIFGVQFHPEKSQRDGLRLLRNFSRL
jgi:glutamine amidotransferase